MTNPGTRDRAHRWVSPMDPPAVSMAFLVQCPCATDVPCWWVPTTLPPPLDGMSSTTCATITVPLRDHVLSQALTPEVPSHPGVRRSMARLSHPQRIRRGRRWQAVARQQIQRQPWCSRCGATSDLTADHIVAMALGGDPYDPRNLDTLCRSCNSKKGQREGGVARRRGRPQIALFSPRATGESPNPFLQTVIR